MHPLIASLILTTFFYSSAQALLCTDNPCQLGGYFTPQRGYQCIQNGNLAICTCPGGLEQDVPCRLCNRVNPLLNVCRNNNGRLITCLEDDSYGTSYACLCSDGLGGGILTSNADCDTTVTLTTPRTTTTLPSISANCVNGGVFYNGICQCPSGYSGTLCSNKNDQDLCNRVICKNNGVCAIRNPNGPYEAVCLCRYGTYGPYCELTGTLGFCSANLCLNGGSCKENVVGSTRHAYCNCAAGYNGPKCENRYFICPGVGRFADAVMFEQGKYFECTNVGGTIRIEQRSCAKGLRYNANAGLCTY